MPANFGCSSALIITRGEVGGLVWSLLVLFWFPVDMGCHASAYCWLYLAQTRVFFRDNDSHSWYAPSLSCCFLQNEDRTLWKLGTLPPGLITFYNLTYALPKRWHVLGLGYNAGVLQKDIEQASVIHYNGNMKPWLEIGMSRYKPYWTKYVKYDHSFLQQCNINI